MTDREWFLSLDKYGKEWRLDLAKELPADPSDAQLKTLLASTAYTLHVAKGGVLDLSPLERFPRLAEVTIVGFKQLKNTAVLSGLSSLRRLTLDRCSVAEISFLGGMTGLEQLSLTHNKLTELSPLAKLTRLVDLDVANNKIVDLSPLAKLTKLEKLTVSVNKVKDLSPLAALGGLRELWASDNAFPDLTPLARLTGLVSLDIEGDFSAGKVKDLTPLAALTKLEMLNISSHPKIPDLSPLAGCVSLQTLKANVLMPKIAGWPALLALKQLKEIHTHSEIMTKPDQAAFKKRKVDVSL